MIWAPILHPPAPLFNFYLENQQGSIFLVRSVLTAYHVVGVFLLEASSSFFVKLPSPKKPTPRGKKPGVSLVPLSVWSFLGDWLLSLYRIPNCRRNSLCQRKVLEVNSLITWRTERRN